MKAVVNESKLTCPGCGYSEVLTMPADACQWYHQCNGCHRLLKPNPEDCCVFCSFGSMPCPPKQAASDHEDSDRG